MYQNLNDSGDWLVKLYVRWNYFLIFSTAKFFFNEQEKFLFLVKQNKPSQWRQLICIIGEVSSFKGPEGEEKSPVQSGAPAPQCLPPAP